MKICPVCQTEFKDGTMRFCTKDGTPLVAVASPEVEAPPTPRALTPIESTLPTPPSLDATLSDVPVSPQQSPNAPSFDPAVSLDFNLDSDSNFPENQQPPVVPPAVPSQPVKPVVKAAPKPKTAPTVAAQKTAAATTSKRRSNTVLYAALGALGVFGLLGIIAVAAIYWHYSANDNRVALTNTNLKTENNNSLGNDNAGVNNNSDVIGTTNLNENSNGNLDSTTDDSINITGFEDGNANARPSPSPRVALSPTPRNANRNANQVIEIEPSQPSPSPVRPASPTPTAAPPQQQQSVRTIAGGVVNGKASSLVKPGYSSAAKSARAEGQVNVQVLIDENGNVVSASAISGSPLLRPAAQQAARQSKFPPTVIGGQPVKVSGVIIYQFTLN